MTAKRRRTVDCLFDLSILSILSILQLKKQDAQINKKGEHLVKHLWNIQLKAWNVQDAQDAHPFSTIQ